MSSNVDSTIDPSTFVSASEACRLLSIRAATLYSYVSRGLLRSHPGDGAARARRYLREDVERLKARHDARSGHAPVAAGALRWGEPVLDSAITSITPRGPSYRGHVAVDLAQRGAPFEQVADLLWLGELAERPRRWPGAARFGRVDSGPGTASPVLCLPALLSALAAQEDARFAVAAALEHERARSLLRALVWIVDPARYSLVRRSRAPIAELVAVLAAGAATEERVRAIDAALVLAADHELNVSSFAARVVASSGADLHACLTAAAAALSGPLHGGASERVEALVDEARGPAGVRRALEGRAKRGETLPGLGHVLYPGGDPRAVALLDLASRLAPRQARVRTLLQVAAEGERAFGQRANLDLGLVAVAAALDAPRGTASALFAIGRAAGWVAHILEQREARFLLRPRARYVGPSGSHPG